MKTAGIITEYNPLHYGHLALIQAVRQQFGEDTAVICAMSGDFVQRGDFALVHRHARAEAAVRSGADLVLELPLPWAVSSAEGFAQGGVEVLTATGLLDVLAFGSECGDLTALQAAEAALSQPELMPRIRQLLAQGMAYAPARQQAAEELGAPPRMLSRPNDILAIEYLKALRRQKAPMEPLAVLRQGAGHDGTPSGDTASASYLRTLLRSGRTDEALSYLPAPAAQVLRRELALGQAPADLSYCQRAILARLRQLREEDFLPYDGGKEGLYHRFYQAVRTSCSPEELLETAKTKRYPTSRLRRMLLAAAVCCVIFAASFALYRLPLRAVLYPVGLCLLVGLGFAVWDYRRTLKRHRALTGCGDLTAELLRELPPPESLAEEDYRAQLLHLRQLCTELQSAADNRYRDAIEYYTTWAHQIKTPIASMRLALQGEDTALFRRLLSDLSRTEQYVEMVMAFLRLEDAPGDYVFREVALDEVLRQALRRFSAEFIDRRLRLDYTPTGLTVLTDEKWLCFVLEQLLSNALKYTREGSITVELAGERVLAIRDTGIGIAPEDLPRIFEKGYTGQNGRADKRASGLGLYLCSRICRNLGVGLTVKSTSGAGTTLLLDFTQYPLRVE